MINYIGEITVNVASSSEPCIPLTNWSEPGKPSMHGHSHPCTLSRLNWLRNNQIPIDTIATDSIFYQPVSYRHLRHMPRPVSVCHTFILIYYPLNHK